MSPHHGFTHVHLHVHGTSAVHRLVPEAKLAGLLAFVLVVALTPRTWVLAFVGYLLIAIGVATLAGLRVPLMLRRLTAIIPFLLFALLLPFFSGPPTADLGPLEMSREGLWSAWNIVAKATLGAAASIVLTATTPIPDVLTGLSRLRVPAVLVGIVAFMFRYLDLIMDDLSRMRRAMAARAYEPRRPWQLGPTAASLGALFARTFERGERIHRAMVARGFEGSMPMLDSSKVGTTRDWVRAMTPALLAAVSATGGGLT